MKYAAWFAVLLGALMFVQWSITLLGGGVPELTTAPWAIAFHLAAEGATAILLLVGGLGAIRARAWSRPLLLLGLGMVAYSAIASAGYFAQSGHWWPVAMFAGILGATVAAATTVARQPSN